ncbi:MAG: hypothetical protein WA970_04825 [Gammaproteobacteria bacterium]
MTAQMICLAGGDARQMFHSLSRLQARFAGSTKVMPGHHYAHQAVSTMAEQAWGNPFFHFHDVETFAQFRAVHNVHRHPPYQPLPRGTPAW